ncbi:MAG: hypothetical protein ACRDL8_23430 [Solirubrobacteraceae bacterium]
MTTIASIPPDLPGADLVLEGLTDLEAGRVSVPALLVLSARRRLARAGIDLPPAAVEDVERTLYLKLHELDPSGAYTRYNALRRRLVSFCDAFEHDARRRHCTANTRAA